VSSILCVNLLRRCCAAALESFVHFSEVLEDELKDFLEARNVVLHCENGVEVKWYGHFLFEGHGLTACPRSVLLVLFRHL